MLPMSKLTKVLWLSVVALTSVHVVVADDDNCGCGCFVDVCVEACCQPCLNICGKICEGCGSALDALNFDLPCCHMTIGRCCLDTVCLEWLCPSSSSTSDSQTQCCGLLMQDMVDVESSDNGSGCLGTCLESDDEYDDDHGHGHHRNHGQHHSKRKHGKLRFCKKALKWVLCHHGRRSAPMHAPTTQRMDQGQSSSDHRPTRHRKQRTRLNRPVMCCLFWTSFVTAAVSVATFKTFTEWLPHAALQSGYKTSCRDLHDSEVVVVGDAVPRHWVEYWAQYDDSFQRLLVLDDNQIVQQQFHIDDLDQTTTVQSLKDGNMVEVGKLPVGSTIASYPAKISAKLDNVTYDVNVKDADKVEVVVGGSSPYVTSKSTTRKMVLTKFTKLRVLGGSREQIGTVWYPAKVSDRKKLKVCVQQAYSSLDADADKKKRQVAFLITKTVGLKPKAAPAPSSRKEKQD